MLLRAFAKINLDLSILGRRADGYHEIRTILQTIDWFDEIRIERADCFEFTCTGGPSEVPCDDGNLAVRAVREFQRAIEEPVNVRVELSKNIPVGAGLGGGSADAAVTLLGLQRLYGRILPEPELQRCLKSLGSDVPFFALGGCAMGIGRGDEVSPVPESGPDWFVVVFSGIRISTADAYSWLTVSGESHTIKGFGAQFMPPGSVEGGRNRGLPGNDFENAVFERHPVLEEIKNELRRLGAVQAALSGSGSAIFGRFNREEDALTAASEMSRYGMARVARPLARPEYLQSVFVGEA
jgi:4-diphosphocytidyl-2-C-methyl-D-erythritol kinase